MPKEIQVAILGCGRVAGHHCLALQETDGVNLAAVCDLQIERAEQYGKMYDVPFYQNYNEMFQNHSDIDVVSIITPSGMHAEHTKEILSNFGKSVIVEKPTFLGVREAERTFSLAKSIKLEIFPIFQNRHNKAVKRVKRAIAEGELGEVRIVSVRVRWCRPQAYYDLSQWRGTFSHDGGALTNQGIHHVDLLTYLGGKVSRVNSVMRTMGAKIEVEDTAVATLEYQHGGLGVVECTTAARPDDFEASISIVGEKGLAQIGGIAVNELQIFTPDPRECGPNSEDFSGINGKGAVYGYGHFQVYKDIGLHLNGEKEYPITETDCMNTLKLLEAFYKSHEVGDWVLAEDSGYSQNLGRINDQISAFYRTPKNNLSDVI